MRKKYSIVFLILTIIFVCLLIFVYRLSYHKAILKMEEQLSEKSVDLDECYYIKATDGYVTVYMADKETVYEYTTISIQELPEEIQKELESGKRVNTVRQVYGFLENYSS